MDNTYIEHISDKFNHITKKPEKFLSAPDKIIDNIKVCLKETYEFIKSGETATTSNTSNTLPTLIINHFDVEQIWQQIELQNNDILAKHLRSVGRLVAQKENLWLVNDDSNENINDSDGDIAEINDDDKNNKTFVDDNDDADDDDDDEEQDKDNETIDDSNIIEEQQNISNKQTQISKKSSVDDDFFKLDEMEKFLNREEQAPNTKSYKENSDDDDDDEDVDLFDMKSDDEFDDKEETSDVENNPKYDEFFGEDNETENNKRKRTKESSDDDDDGGGSETEDITLKSSLELKNERLHRRIDDIEEQALQDKSWQYKGEVTADKRPQNSLLEEIVDFDMTVRPAPVITEETTYKLEDVIKKRIKDKVWDDVERKTKLVDTFVEYKKKLMLDQEKSKQSLAQIYEDEYLKKKEASNPDAADDKPEKEPIEHTEIKLKMRNLFTKLDALSNFHFTPKSVAPELRVVNNLPAINMEEVTPIASSEAAQLAPEEIKKKLKGDTIGKTERTKTDKNRQRRQKKLKQKEHAKVVENKEKTTLKKKYDKQKAGHLLDKITKDSNVNKMNESGIGAKSSTAFFTQLQDEVRGHIHKKSTQMQKKKNKATHIAKKLKL